MRQTQFVVLTTQRSGSSWLIDLLNAHPEIAAYGEMFRVTDTTVPIYGARDVPSFEVMVPPGVWSVSKVLFRRRYEYVRSLGRAHPDARAVGFKLMYDQTRDHPGLLETLVARRTRVIHLVRRDHLSALVSFDVAFGRDRWRYHEGDELPAARVQVDTGELLRRLDERAFEIARFQQRLSRLPVRVCEVAYEDLRERRDDVLRRLLDFLAVPPVRSPLGSTLVPTGSVSGLDAVENRDEVVAALSGTPYAALVRAPDRRVAR
jgi:LPS sulfotransferase NodH